MDSPGNNSKFSIGDRVIKATGYAYPGIVVSVFETCAGKLRYVVEHTVSVGMLHIFNEEQLEIDTIAVKGEFVER